METTLIEIPPFLLDWSARIPWDRLARDARTDPQGISMPDGPGVCEARLATSESRLTIGKASNLRMRVKQRLVKGKVPHSCGKRIRQTEPTAQILIRWAETDGPACVEEELHRRHIAVHGELPKYTERT